MSSSLWSSPSSKVHGRSPILMDLDNKLLTFLKGIRSRGGVINIHVVQGVTHGCITSNPAMTYLNNFDMPHSLVHSIYKRMGYTEQAGTTPRPPMPYGLYTENRYTFLSNIVKTVEQYSIPFELILRRLRSDLLKPDKFWKPKISSFVIKKP